jgi:hypothetical protein
MRLERVSNRAAVQVLTLDLEPSEVRALRAALGEVCFGFRVEDFTGRIGVTEGEARALFGRLDALGLGCNTTFGGTRGEILAIRNAHAETLRELGIEEYSTRTGVDFEEGQAQLRALDETLGNYGAQPQPN